jgi:hypothetical protein
MKNLKNDSMISVILNLAKFVSIAKNVSEYTNIFLSYEPLAKVFHITLYYGSDSVFYLTFQVLGTL